MPILTDEELARRARDLEWVLCDVDGVLTDGALYYDRRGGSILRFNVKDGMGLKLAQRAGLRVGILSSRSSVALEHRAAELGLDLVLTNVADKGPVFDEFLKKEDLPPRAVAFIGDDIQDLVVLGRCGLAFAPADAASEVLTLAHRVMDRNGGKGAVREMIELVLRARGDWEKVLTPFSFDA